jgi:D-alanyl-D-alanine carboxypeptidase/D-alanyl-D-alanine-endopeptidase (penicillin-binding protein 4)
MNLRHWRPAIICAWACCTASVTLGEGKPLPADLQAVLDKPLYKSGVWGLLVVDLDTGEVVYDLRSERKMLTGSVRKLFSIGLALDKLGVDYRFTTPVFRRGDVANGVLDGDLILVASGDLAMGGRTNPDGSLAISDYDHNEANSLGNAELTKPDPLAGFESLARQVAAAGIKEVRGDVIIDDRRFVPFNFRGEFDVRPIFVNDDLVDVIIEPGTEGGAASVDWRPKSAAFAVDAKLTMAAAGSAPEIELSPEFPKCMGDAGCRGEVSGKLPLGFTPPLTKRYPLIRTFRIVEPQNYARTVFIEALREAGVVVAANPVAENPSDKLPRLDLYAEEMQVAELKSPPYAEYAKWILKVSYNIGADTSLVLFGLTQGVNSMPASLEAEKKTLASEFDIQARDFHFIDGSGGGESAATPAAVVSFLRSVRGKPFYPAFYEGLPILAVDGSLGFVTDFTNDPALAGAKGHVHAKTGTFLTGGDDGVLSLRAQTLAGYIEAKSGRRLAFALFVNDVSPVTGLDDVLQVFQDQGTISAILWREH